MLECVRFKKYGLRTVQSVLDELTDNAQLKALLCGQFGDYGVRVSFSPSMHILRHIDTENHVLGTYTLAPCTQYVLFCTGSSRQCVVLHPCWCCVPLHASRVSGCVFSTISITAGTAHSHGTETSPYALTCIIIIILHSGFYPVGGPQVISRAIVAFIESRGG